MIKKKRAALEQFIREQTLGPGISGYRFVDFQNEALMMKNLLKEKPLDYVEEILDTAPAGVYSTGILFPRDNSKLDEKFLANPFENEGSDGHNDGVSEGDAASIEDESVPFDQMYPNTMGFTWCIQNDIDTLKDIRINVQARYYKKIRPTETVSGSFGVLCECDPDQFSDFIARLGLNTLINIKTLAANKVLTVGRVKPEQTDAIQKLLRNTLEEEALNLKQELKEFHFAKKLSYASALKQACYYELRNAPVDTYQRQKLFSAITRLESIENFISHIQDLLTIGGNGHGLWKSEKIDTHVSFSKLDLSQFNDRRIFSYQKYECLRDIFKYELGNGYASLSLNVQLSRDTRKMGNKTFVKVQLVNTSTPFVKNPNDSRYYSPFNEVVNERAFFGVKLAVSHKNLVPYNALDLTRTKDHYNEDDVTKFVHRQFKDYAVGHGCSVKWKEEGSLVTIETEYLPICDTPEIEPIPRNKNRIIKNAETFEPEPYLNDSKALQFKWLSIFSSATDTEVIVALKQFVQLYQDWIDAKRLTYANRSILEQEIAEQELAKCQADKDRMLYNIETYLKGDPNSVNLRSFRTMNAAMFMQLWHSVNVKEGLVSCIMNTEEFNGFDFRFYQEADDRLFDGRSSVAWRPFQLAFILLNLDGIFRHPSEISWKMRNDYVDLVWFPTGGGKTEAYLGIIALAIIHRRVTYDERGGGTAAIMRYTLRLLALQQFQRATLMIMALELVRRWNTQTLGEEPIFIGLWVGDNSLPNKISSSNPEEKNTLQYEFRKLAEGQKSKVPFEYCPWCGSQLDPATTVEQNRANIFHYNRLHLRCSNVRCSFYFRAALSKADCGPIPVSLCDDEIYQHPPALLFGTVDKFAQLAHKVSDKPEQRNKDSRRIFGNGNWEKGKPSNGYLPPDLIIQDELHLLLGPLGSAVALFESAIDQLCTRPDGTRPKVISSTATTRNTELQIMALFDRQVNIFPKQGVECDDSFFAFYKRTYSNKYGEGPKYSSQRRYMGVLPTGRTQIWMQMRLAAILMTHRALFEISELGSNTPLNFHSYRPFQEAMDYYHTIVSYFNSLKEVGKTESQVHSYLLKEVRRVFNRVIRPAKLSHAFYTYSIKKSELTGRLSGEEVKSELNRVQQKWRPEDRLAHLSAEGTLIQGSTPPDIVVATNMIAVGIDVARFNTMIINSMPRNIAEYIQASSRVARDSYGLVLTIHHPFRARDVSHYEKFMEFHEKMYSYVEPISITPFTQKSIDRYFGLYLATMLRHRTRFVNRESAEQICQLSTEELQFLVSQLTNYFAERCNRLQSSQADNHIKYILKHADVQLIRDWIERAIEEWREYAHNAREERKTLVFQNRSKRRLSPQEQLYVDVEEYEDNIHSYKWQIPMSLRVLDPEAVLKIKLK